MILTYIVTVLVPQNLSLQFSSSGCQIHVCLKNPVAIWYVLRQRWLRPAEDDANGTEKCWGVNTISIYVKLTRSFWKIKVHCTWEFSSSPGGQQISCILRNRRVHCRVHNSPSRAPVLGQISPVHTIPSCKTLSQNRTAARGVSLQGALRFRRNIRKYGARFPYAKEFHRKLSAVWARSHRNVCQCCGRTKRF